MRRGITLLYKIKIHNFEKQYLLDEMIRTFLSSDEYVLLKDNDVSGSEDQIIHFNKNNSNDKNEIKREIYVKLSSLTDKYPEWGILTGIRPVKLWGENVETLDSEEKASRLMKDKFLLSDEKINLIKEIYRYQVKNIGKIKKDNSSLYIGIPFCPTRCSYCSFASNQVGDIEINRYFQALIKEVEKVGKMMQEADMSPRSIYIGGGTPTTLNENQLNELFCAINESIPQSKVKEITLEAGRPDTITYGKLYEAAKGGVNRISINPQSMRDSTLIKIGRNHDSKMILEAFDIAKKLNFQAINCDVIAGLPGETLSDFAYTIDKILELGANNITIHSLAVKRGSKLIEKDENYYHKIGNLVGEMLMHGRNVLTQNGFRPYYLYRQKHMAGAYENTGYCKDDTYCIYNMAIMDEHEDIIALGAGGISKAFYIDENRLERIPNVTNYEEYINRIDEMIERKRLGMFERRTTNAN